MSFRALFGNVISRLGRTQWGAKIETPQGPVDTGVQRLAEELQAMLNSAGQIRLSGPIEIYKDYTGPLFQVRNSNQDDDSDNFEYLTPDE